MQSRAVCFEKSNVEDLKEKLSELLNDEDMVDAFKDMAQEYICEKYDWDSVVIQTIRLYEGVKNEDSNQHK